jgi:hypothetical protein
MTNEYRFVRRAAVWTVFVHDENGDFVDSHQHDHADLEPDFWIESEDMVDRLYVPSEGLARELLEKLADGDLDGLDDAATQYSEAEIG